MARCVTAAAAAAWRRARLRTAAWRQCRPRQGHRFSALAYSSLAPSCGAIGAATSHDASVIDVAVRRPDILSLDAPCPGDGVDLFSSWFVAAAAPCIVTGGHGRADPMGEKREKIRARRREGNERKCRGDSAQYNINLSGRSPLGRLRSVRLSGLVSSRLTTAKRPAVARYCAAAVLIAHLTRILPRSII